MNRALKVCVLSMSYIVLSSCKTNTEDLFCFFTADPPPRIIVTVTSQDDAASKIELCSADVRAISPKQYHHELARLLGPGVDEVEQVCQFGDNRPMPSVFDLEVHLAGYKTVAIRNIDRTSDTCDDYTMEVEVELEPSQLDCAEGYADHAGVCSTPAGCQYPLLQERIAWENIYWEYSCTDNCQNGLGEEHGNCASAAFSNPS